MGSHLVNLAVFSLLVSVVFATLLRNDLTSRVRLGVKIFGALVLSVLAIGWLMYPFPD